MNMPSASAGLFDYFLGRWQFVRTMGGLDGAPIGTAGGTATFRPQTDGQGLHYDESGKLQLVAEARTVRFSRRFDYRMQDQLMLVSFADGPQAGEAYQHYRYDPVRQALLPVATHVCLQDHYDGDYRLLDQDHFDLQTRIDGPHKDYLLLTRFVRASQA